MSLSDYPSVFFNDLMTTVASSIDINTGFAEREAETVAQSIFCSFFHVSNLHGVTFSDASGKLIKVPDSDIGPADFTYFLIHSHVFAATVDHCALTKTLTLEFSLHLPQSLRNSDLLTTVIISPVKIPSHLVVDLEFTLGTLSDDILSDMESDQMRNLLINIRDTIAPASLTPSPLVEPLKIYSTPTTLSSVPLPSSTTPKIDRIRSIALFSGVMIFTGHLNYLNYQTIFDPSFGINPTMIRLLS